jgi:transcriptional antiterminator NusG
MSVNFAWYILQVYAKKEDSVRDLLVITITNEIEKLQKEKKLDKVNLIKESFGVPDDHVSTAQIKDYLMEHAILVPKEKIEDIRNGKKVEIFRKIFPGYILIKMQYNNELGLLIYSIGNVSLVGGYNPTPIPQQDVDDILSQVKDSNDNKRYRVEFDIDEKVRVIDGPFVDFNGNIQEVFYSKKKLKVNIQIFGRDTLVELNFNQVEKLS